MCLVCGPVFGQQGYLAGIGRESLQPGRESFTLALAGYGAPREGRFTLDWEDKGMLSAAQVLGGVRGELYAQGPKGNLQVAPAGRFPLAWAPAGTARPATSLTGDQGQLLLLDKCGRVYRRKAGKQKWRKAGIAPGMKQIVLEGATLYGLSDKGEIRQASLEDKRWQWQTLGRLAGARSFVVYRHIVYAATGSDTLYRFNARYPAGGWVNAGYDNKVIRKVNLHRLLVAGDKLYAADEQGRLFEALKTEGQPADELSVTALAIRQNQQTVLLLGADLCGFDDSLIRQVKQELSRKRGLPAAAVLVNASHTHFAPVTQAWTTWGPHNQVPDTTYLYQVVKPALLKAAEEALDHLAPANLYFGRGKTDIGRNRSNGKLETPYDDAVDVLRVESREGGRNYVLVLAGCHPVFGTAGRQNYTISANYPGYFRRELEAQQAQTTALFLQGCAGDINPRDPQPEVTGKKLAASALQVLAQEMTPLQGSLSFHLDTLQVKASPMSREQVLAFRGQNDKEPGNVDKEKNVRWADLMLKRYDTGTMPAFMPVYLQTLNIGNWKLVGLSREVVTEYSLAIKGIWPAKLVSVAGYCNDVASYLPVERHIRTRTYEGINSSLWYGQPSPFPTNILDLVVERVRSKNY